jgi:hypothetical protein
MSALLSKDLTSRPQQETLLSPMPLLLLNATTVSLAAVFSPSSKTPSRVSHTRQCRQTSLTCHLEFDTFDKTVTSTLPPLDFDKSVNLFDQKLDCPASGDVPAISAEVKSDIDAKAHAVISVGVAVTGTIVPPILISAGVFAGMDASVTGTLTLTGSAGVSYSSDLSHFI